ncbi:MAG: ribokinase [Armatimonadetes bacterium]|nr:ribokinase [Armatimonadota bacterium]
MAVEVAVVGNVNIDFVIRAKNLPQPGQNVTADGMQLAPGGKGANQAVAAARLGAIVYLISRLGKDPFGALLLQHLKKANVDTSCVAVDQSKPTGCAFVTVLPDGENAIISALGANMALTPADVEQAFAELEHLDAIVVQMGIPLACVDRVIQIGTDRDIPVLFDPTPMREGLPRLWRYATTITPNASEAEALTGIKVTNIASAFEAAENLHGRGIKRVVVKLGAKGCVLFDEEGARRVRAYQVQAVDTTGAGDTFAAALAVRLAEGASFDDAALFATAAAAIACTKPGAEAAMPTRQQVESFMARRGKRGMVSSRLS